MDRRKLDINTASVDEFASLSGIGQIKAKAIVYLRNELGQFTEVNDLQKVPGIGSVLMDQNRPILKCRTVKVKQRPKISKAARRIASRAASGRPLVKGKPTLPVASNCDASLPTISCQRRYNTRRNGSENISQALTSSPAKKTKCRYKRCSKVAAARTVSLPRRSTRWGRVAADPPPVVPANVQPCSSRGADGGSSSTAAGDLPSKHTSTGNSGGTLALPSSSKCSDNSQNAQNPLPRRRGFFHARRGNPPRAAEDRGAGLRSPDAGGAGEVGGRAVCGLAENACAQQMASALDDDSATSTQSNPSISHEVPEKPRTKRKPEPSEDCRGPKKFCCNEENSSELLDETSYEQQIMSAVDAPQSSSMRRQKIPSKKNPPPLLIGWLKTFQNWTHAERLLALDELMEICDPTEVRHVMQVIEPQFQRDFISLLPKELALYVLSFLEPNDLLRAAQTCRYWHMLAEDNILWREKCHEEGISESLVFGNIVRRKRPSSKSLWKSLFLRQQQIEKNWRASSRAPKVLKGHDDHVITCLEFNGMKIVSGSDDNTLKVWSAVTGKCLRTLTGHTGGVWSSQMSGNVIISGSTDRTLKVWDADTGRTIFTLYGHTSTVRCMHLHKNRVVSGSRDATLRMWDVETGHCLHVLIGHMAAVRCVQYDGRRVVSGAYDYMVKIWDPEKETCLQTLAGHTNRVYSLQFDGVHIVSGSLDTSIRVWSAETGACLHTLVGHQSLTSGMELKDNILVSGNADSTVKVWNITTGQCLQTLNGPNKHQSAVTCLQFNRKLIITSSDDGTIKIWDLRTGEFIRNLVTLESGGSGGVVWRIRCNNSKLVCAVGSRNGTEETKLLVLDFDVEDDAPQSAGRVAATVAAS